MLELVKGCTVHNPGALWEGYKSVDDNILLASVNASKIQDVFGHFIVMHENEQMFFILELPTSLDNETTGSDNVVNAFHVDVYYIDGCSAEECVYLLNTFGELLINDGSSKFGFGCHESQDEIMLGKYNAISIYSLNLPAFEGFFEAHDITINKALVMAGDTITPDTPGICARYEVGGKTVYDLPKLLEEWGIYKAEMREE